MLAASLAASLVVGCGPQGQPGAGDSNLANSPKRPAATTSTGIALARARLEVTHWRDLRTFRRVATPVPRTARGIGPGSPIMITIPNEGRFGCTANFIWESAGTIYLGAAGHCFVPEGRAATHGPGADFDASGVTVDVCVDDCAGNFRLNELIGAWVTLGRVAYARQALDGVEVGNDFGVVEIPTAAHRLIRTRIPVWGGPTGVGTLERGDFACLYGNGLDVGKDLSAKARVGLSGGSGTIAWMGDFAGASGDSGSGLVECESSERVGMTGTVAIGVLTHLGVGLVDSLPEHGFVLGTTIARAIAMGEEAGLNLALVEWLVRR